MDDVRVSIICATYNHEKYIIDALDSFLMQETSFRFEVIVHDDASTDSTPEIICEYASKYPDIIIPVLQKENVYSRKIPIYQTYLLPLVRGEYIASCEGDDYWLDKRKLQKQVDIMDNHKELDICAHSAVVVYANTKKIKGYIRPSHHDTIFSLDQVINGGGGFVSTNSLLYRFKIDKNIPDFRSFAMDDYAKQIHGSLRGGMYFLKDTMSVYRYMSDTSWTKAMSLNLDSRKKERDKLVKFLNMVDAYTKYEHSNVINNRIVIEKAIVLELENKCRMLLTKEYRPAWDSYSILHKLKIVVKAVFPFLHGIRRKKRNRIDDGEQK